MAFKMERDDFYFTSKRFLFRDKKGVSGHRVEYTSVPYRAIQGYQITTPGALLDFSSELEIWCSGMETIKMGFAKEKCDIFAVQMYFLGVLGGQLCCRPVCVRVRVDICVGAPGCTYHIPEAWRRSLKVLARQSVPVCSGPGCIAWFGAAPMKPAKAGCARRWHAMFC